MLSELQGLNGMHTCWIPGGVDDDDTIGSGKSQAQAANLQCRPGIWVLAAVEAGGHHMGIRHKARAEHAIQTKLWRPSKRAGHDHDDL